jgi:hypothetical protein
VILPSDFVDNIAAVNQYPERSQQIMQSIPWRFDHFGEEIIKVFEKQEA